MTDRPPADPLALGEPSPPDALGPEGQARPEPAVSEPDPDLFPLPATFEVGLAPWTFVLPGLPIALGAAVAIWELGFAQRPLAGLLLLAAGLVVFWLRAFSRVRIADGHLHLRWLWPVDQRVDLERLVEARPARSLSFGLGAVNVLRLRDWRGDVVDLPLDRWAHEPELRAIIAAAARQAGV